MFIHTNRPLIKVIKPRLSRAYIIPRKAKPVLSSQYMFFMSFSLSNASVIQNC